MKFGIHVGHMAGPLDELRELCRLNIAFREGPYAWEALEAFAAEIVSTG
jgi:hypothetical protein